MKNAGTSNNAFRQRAVNCSASILLTLIAYLIYRFSPHTQSMRGVSWQQEGTFNGSAFLSAAFVAYCLALILFYLFERAPHESKSVAAIRGLFRTINKPRQVFKNGLPDAERLGVLSVSLKAFFAPLMLLSLFGWTNAMVMNGEHVFEHLPSLRVDFLSIFNTHGFWFLFQLIVFADITFFTIGYLVEHPRLKNQIRSVDRSWQGWAVTLACYPPINGITNWLLGGSATEFPQFDNPVVHVAVNVAVLVLMAIYAWASVALNLKASNLTHRGIIHHGPYRYIRHPAYVCKNAAWWLGSLPVIAAAWTVSWWSALVALAATAAWTGLYALRALTEEDHLRKVDGEYDAYCQKVRYRFIPGVL